MPRRSLLAGAMLTLAATASIATAAVDVAGVSFEDSSNVAAQSLTLNGAGVRTRIMFKVYAMGLYLPQRTDTPTAIQNLPGSKRIRIVTLRDLGTDQFIDALIEGLKKNHPPEALASIQPSIDAFRNAMLTLKEAPKGTEVLIDWIPGGGTRLTVGGTRRGDDIPDERFYAALLRIWLGEQPADNDLKKRLLGSAT
ncbi:hypothetical protein GPA25_18785 [Aromatoleum diolicum]|uniref:Chalcone isomerase domain-containing protein n=2 Tax=Aromatoleum diolicum TaxID=75796 RepID=A0ABX1QES7_9RHOO|nr:chalcone isomerase family protein [Aromatoleum diolicum]NMG76803.1 hypothetical protein [Aromatoleum diolicum]